MAVVYFGSCHVLILALFVLIGHSILGWKFWHKTKIVGVHEMDFVTHVAELDAYEQKCAEE